MPREKKDHKKKISDMEEDLSRTEQKRAERALQLAIRKLEKEGVKDYVVKVWRH